MSDEKMRAEEADGMELATPLVPIPIEQAICLPPDSEDVQLLLHGRVPNCPFCNGTPTTFMRFFEHSGIYQGHVHCSRCHATIFVNSRDSDDARSQALALWSKRHPSPAQPDISALVEALTRPIIGIENRTAQEVFDIMAHRIRLSLQTAAKAGGA